MIFLYSSPRKVNGTSKSSGFDELSSPVGPNRSLALVPNGNMPDNFKRGTPAMPMNCVMQEKVHSV